MKKKPTPPSAPDPLALAQADLDRALSLVDEAIGLVRRHAVPLTPDMRATSAGKLRAGEAGVLAEILDAADGNPHLTAAHGDSDGGVDPDRFETELLRQWLAQHRAFAQTLTALEPKVAALQSLLSDTTMHFGARARRPTLRVYRDLAALAQQHAPLRDQLRTALAFFGDIARKGHRTRRSRT